MPEIKHEVKPEPSTSTTSTSVIIPPTQQQVRGYDEWGVASIFLSAAIGVIMVIGAILSIINSVSSWLKDRKADEKEKDAPLEKRISDIEGELKTFLTKEILDKEFGRLEDKIDHQKDNVSMAMTGMSDRHNALSRTVTELQTSVGKLDTRVENLSDKTDRLDNSIEKLKDRMDERFDDLRDVLLKNV